MTDQGEEESRLYFSNVTCPARLEDEFAIGFQRREDGAEGSVTRFRGAKDPMQRGVRDAEAQDLSA